MGALVSRPMFAGSFCFFASCGVLIRNRGVSPSVPEETNR